MSKLNWLAFLAGNRAGTSRRTRRVRRRKSAAASETQLLESRELLTIVDLRADGTIVADNVSQFAPGAPGKVGFDKFVGATFNTGEHTIGGFALETGVEATFGLQGRVGFDVGAFVNPGSVTATSDLELVQSVPSGGSIMPGPTLIATDVIATNGAFETTSPSLGGYADLVAELSGIAQLEYSVLGFGDTIGGRFGLDLGQELFAINRDDDRQIRILGENLEASGSIEKETSQKPRTALKLDYSGDASHVNATAWSVLGGQEYPNGTKDPSIEKRLGALDVWSPKIETSDFEADSFTLLRGSGEDDLASLKFDVSPAIGQALGIGAGLGTTAIDFGIGRAEVTTVKLDVGPELAFLQTAEVLPKNVLRYDFRTEVGVFKNGMRVTDTTNDPNKVTSVVFDPVSDEISLDFTGQPIDVSPTWQQTLEFRNDIDFAIQLAGRLEVGKIDLTVDFPWPVGSKSFTLGPLYSLPFQQNLGAFDVFADTFTIAEDIVSLPAFTVGEGYELEEDDLVVTTTEDVLWTPADPRISLRHAIRNANLNPGHDVIELGAGIYTLDGIGDEFPDLEITDDLTIIGVGAATVINGSDTDVRYRSRIFDVAAGVSLTLDGMDIRNGIATDGDDGGAIRNRGTLTMIDAWVASSTASGNGGGIFNAEGATLSVTGALIRNNTATGTGGGIHNEGTLNVTATELYDNTSTNFGGGAIYNVGEGVITHSAISDNSGTYGGGLENHLSGTLDVIGSTVSGNTAQMGGGGINNESTGLLVLSSSTVTNNLVEDQPANGAGVLTNGNVEFFNSIFSGNQGAGTTGRDVTITAAPVRADYNVVGFATTTAYFPNASQGGTNVRDATPELSPFGDHGGATRSHVPLPGSPAIGNGAPAGVIDQRDAEFDDGIAEIGSIQMVDSITVARLTPRGSKRSDWQGEPTLQDVVKFFNAAGADTKTINLLAGTYHTTEELKVGGDFDGEFIIAGQGPGVTVIDAQERHRVLHNTARANLDLSGVTLTGGSVYGERGGGISNLGVLEITDGIVEGNRAIVDDTNRDSPRGGDGGGIFNASALTLNRVIVRGNEASIYGGAIYSGRNGDVVTVADSVISENQAALGGGFYNYGSDLDIRSTTISNNTARGTAGGHGFRNAGGGGGGAGLGGGIAALFGNTTLNQVTISNNEAIGGNGGNVAGGAAILESENDFYAFSESGSWVGQTGGDGGGIGGGQGGTIQVYDGSSDDQNLLEIYRLPAGSSGGESPGVDFRGGGGGAGIPLQTGDSLGVSNVYQTFGGSGQRGGGGGGAGATGVQTYNGSNQDFQGGGGTQAGGGVGSAPTFGAGVGGDGTPTRGGGGGGGGAAGGAIFFGQGSLIINSSTITENTSRGGQGGTGLDGTIVNEGQSGVGVTGGIYHYVENNGGTLEIANSVVSGNSADLVEHEVDLRGEPASLGYNLIGWSSDGTDFPTVAEGGTNIRDATPELGPLADNGGFGETHVPLHYSPALDGGSTTDTVDQSGSLRGIGGQDDIGAVESHELIVVSFEDGNEGRTLRQALADAALIDGHNTITLLAGTYDLDSPLVIDSDVTLVGAGADLTAIDGSAVTGDLIVVDGFVVVFEGLTIEGPESGRILDLKTGSADIIESELVGGENGVPAGWPTRDGGIILASSNSVLNITGSTLTSGQARNRGGAITARGNSVTTISSSTIHGSTATQGGDAIFLASNAELTIRQSTIASGEEDYAGVSVLKADGTTLELHNTIIDGGLSGTVVSLGHNLIGDASAASGLVAEDIINTNPILGELGDIGGPTRSVRPESGSPAVDAGDSSGVQFETEDQRGLVRSLGDGADIGAVEREELWVTRTTDDLEPGSLRRAVIDANQLPWAAKIVVDPGEYRLTIRGDDEDGSLTGDLDITGDVTITGEGVGETIINVAAARDRAFDVLADASLGLSNLKLTGGSADIGGNIRNAGSLQLSYMELANGNATDGGGVANLATGDVSVRGTLLVGNDADKGGAIHNEGDLEVLSSTFSDNTADGEGGAVANRSGGLAWLSNVTVSENSATEGGGLWNENTGSFELLNTIVASNLGTDADVSGGFSATHSFIGTVGSATGFDDASNITGTNAAPADPLLGSLTDNGGFTRSYRPAANSPVVDAGLDQIEQGIDPETNEIVEDGVPADQRGLFRNQRDDSTAANSFDIGAVEAQFDYTHRIERESSVTIQQAGSEWTEVTNDNGDDVVRIINPYRSLTVVAQDGEDTLEHYTLGQTEPGLIINIDDVLDTGSINGRGGDILTLNQGSVWNPAGSSGHLFVDGEVRGTGTIVAPAEFSVAYSTSVIAPAGGAITIDGVVTGTGTYAFELAGDTPGEDYGYIVATDTLTLGVFGSQVRPPLQISIGSSVTGSEFLLIDNQGTEDVAGHFDGLPEGSEVDVDGRTFTITYEGGDGNDVVLEGESPIVVDNRTLRITGTDRNDTIHVDVEGSDYVVRGNFDGSPFRQEFSQSAIDRVWVDAQDGQDYLDTRGVNIPTTLLGGGGNDQLRSGSANDSLDGGNGDDYLNAATGDDAIHGGSGDDVMYGGDGHDLFSGTSGDNTVFGGLGDDTVTTGGGQDSIVTNGGDDSIVSGGGSDRILPSGGDDTVYAGAGDDFVGSGSQNDLVYGGTGNDELRTGNGKDTVFGGSGDDSIVGGRGDDTAYGESGDDSIVGNTGNDLLIGGTGNDSLGGNQDRDGLFGGLGADILKAGGGEDLLIPSTAGFDTDADALNAIMQEWFSGRSFEIRVANLRDGSGSTNRLNGSNFLSVGSTISDDSSRDELRGSGGIDWFFAEVSGANADQLFDLRSNELLDEL